MSDARNAWRRDRIAAGLCADCGAARPPSHAECTRCPACAAKHRAANDRLRRAKRIAEGMWGDHFGGDPLPLGGGAPRLGAVTIVRVRLTRQALAALDALKARYRDAELAAGRRPKPYQTSRIIRETIRRWARPGASGGYHPVVLRLAEGGLAVCFQIDAETLAVLDREAVAHFGGSRMACVRAMLVTAANPPLVCAVGRRRHTDA